MDNAGYHRSRGCRSSCPDLSIPLVDRHGDGRFGFGCSFHAAIIHKRGFREFPSLRQLRHSSLGKADRGVVREYLQKVTGLSRSQVTRLIRQYRDTGRVRDRRGPAVRKLCERAWKLDGDPAYERLATISKSIR